MAKGFIYTPQGFEKFLQKNLQLLATAGAENQNMVSVVDSSGVAGSIPLKKFGGSFKDGVARNPMNRFTKTDNNNPVNNRQGNDLEEIRKD